MAKKNTTPEAGDITNEEPLSAAESEARAEVASQTPAPKPKGISEEQIAEKVAAGLTRAQAIEVIERQADWDKHPNSR